MKTYSLTKYAVLTGVLLLSPQTGLAQRSETTPATQGNRYSDRDRSVEWNKQKEVLQQSLKLGETKEQYRRELEKMGWTITAVNYDKPDYVEWEIVKGDQSYEVQIDLDKANKASKIDVTTPKKRLKGIKSLPWGAAMLVSVIATGARAGQKGKSNSNRL